MSDLGERFLSTTFYDKFTTVNASGVPTTLGSTPSLQFYVNGGTTAFTVGLSLDADWNSVTGLNHITVIATTSATAWATASDIQVVVATGTVSGVSIKGYVVCTFSLQNRGALRPTVFGRTLDVSSTGEGGVDWANVGGQSTSVNLSSTTTNLVNTATTLTNLPAITSNWLTAAGIAAGALDGKGNWNIGKTGYSLTATTGLGNQTADITGNLSGSVGSVTGAVGSVTGAVGSVTGNVGGNVVGSVGSVTGAVGSVTGAVGSVTGNVGGNVVGSVASVTAAVAITSNIKINQALAGFEFLMTDSTNHEPATGLTVTVTRSINGGAFAAGTLSAVSEIGNGIYSVDFGAGDLNGKVITLQATAAASDTTFERIVTQA